MSSKKIMNITKWMLICSAFLAEVEGVCFNPTLNDYTGQSHVCMSITEFKLLSKNKIPTDAKQIKCPNRQVCVDTSEICVDSSKAQATCANPSKCKFCSDGFKYACISATEFVPCHDKKPLFGFVQKCPSTEMYCGFKMSHDMTEYPCTADETKQACQMELGDENADVEENDDASMMQSDCKQIGAQAIKSDITCKSYFYCSLNNGEFSRKKYMCPGNYVFHPGTKKCVSKSQYKCPSNTKDNID